MNYWEAFKEFCPFGLGAALFCALSGLSFWLCVARPLERMNRECVERIMELRKRLGMDGGEKTSGNGKNCFTVGESVGESSAMGKRVNERKDEK